MSTVKSKEKIGSRHLTGLYRVRIVASCFKYTNTAGTTILLMYAFYLWLLSSTINPYA